MHASTPAERPEPSSVHVLDWLRCSEFVLHIAWSRACLLRAVYEQDRTRGRPKVTPQDSEKCQTYVAVVPVNLCAVVEKPLDRVCVVLRGRPVQRILPELRSRGEKWLMG